MLIDRLQSLRMRPLRRRLTHLAAGALLALAAAGWLAWAASAQLADPAWTDPQRLSSLAASASAPYLAADAFGQVHLVWIETPSGSNQAVLRYARFNGERWAGPFEIFKPLAGTPIASVSISAGPGGQLLVAYLAGNGPVRFYTVPAYAVPPPNQWPESLPIPGQPDAFELRAAPDGGLHFVYTRTKGSQRGLYYQFSADAGLSWSGPVRLDPGRPAEWSPDRLAFEIDPQGGLHLLWNYEEKTGAAAGEGRDVRYLHSLDGGKTWSDAVIIDAADETPDELRISYPAMAVDGDKVYAVWAGDSELRREFRFSNDRGRTWGITQRFSGELQGQTRGDGLAVDSAGRLHFVANIRWPAALYHAAWDGRAWSKLALFYLIKLNFSDDSAGRITAHDVRLAVRAGNQLVAAFGDTPGQANRGLYITSRTLGDAPALLPQPAPTATAAPTAAPTPAPTGTATATAVPTAIPTPTPAGLRLPGGITVGYGMLGVYAAVLILALGAGVWFGARSERPR